MCMTLRRRLCLWLAALLTSVCAWSAAADPIYKCGDASTGVVYTDAPCEGGERLDIQAGVADPAAVERLQGARDALDRSADRRRAIQDRDAARQADANWMMQDAFQTPQPSEEAYPYYDDGYGGGWYVPAARRRPVHTRPLPEVRPRFAPKPPYLMPRR
jgi:hypothetical protein